MKTNIPSKSKQIVSKQEPPSCPPTPPAKLSDFDIDGIFDQQMLRETMRHITDDGTEEEDASIVGAGFSRPTPGRTLYNYVATDTDQLRRNSVRE
jgi:hypothetical protein